MDFGEIARAAPSEDGFDSSDDELNVLNVAVLQLMEDEDDEQLVNELALPLIDDRRIAPRQRRRRARVLNYVEETVIAYNDDLFAEHFRMRRATFQQLLVVIGHQMLQPIENLEKCLLYTLWLLAKPESFLAVGDRFNIAKSSGHAVFKRIVGVLRDLLPQYIMWPNANTYAAIAQAFSARGRLPGVIGAIDGCHIQIKQPQHNAVDYYNRKGVHSMILQGICDASGKFIDVVIGMPGRMHDARVFRNSEVYMRLTDGENPLIPSNYHLLGDSAYPLMENLMTPYRDNGHLSPVQSAFNTQLSSLRSAIERCFGRLKGKFRRLFNLDIADLQLGKEIIAASCVLHNFILIHEGEQMYAELNEDVNEVDLNEEGRDAYPNAIFKRDGLANNL